MNKNFKTLIFGFLAMAFSFFGMSSAHATGVDLSTLTAAVDFSTTTTAILGVAAALMVVYIAWKAAKMVVGAVRGL